MLSHVARLDLITSVFSSIPVYYMSNILFTNKFIAKLIGIIETFWWTGIRETNSIKKSLPRSLEGYFYIQTRGWARYKKSPSNERRSNSCLCVEACQLSHFAFVLCAQIQILPRILPFGLLLHIFLNQPSGHQFLKCSPNLKLTLFTKLLKGIYPFGVLLGARLELAFTTISLSNQLASFILPK